MHIQALILLVFGGLLGEHQDDPEYGVCVCVYEIERQRILVHLKKRNLGDFYRRLMESKKSVLDLQSLQTPL